MDDVDPVAALAVADGALRAGADGSLRPESLGAAVDAAVINRCRPWPAAAGRMSQRAEYVRQSATSAPAPTRTDAAVHSSFSLYLHSER